MRSEKKSHSWREALKLINKCPICGANYPQEGAKVFAAQKQVNLVHFSCLKCSGNFIAMIMVMNRGISTVGMVTDLDFEDASRFRDFEPITIDELIEGRAQITNVVNI